MTTPHLTRRDRLLLRDVWRYRYLTSPSGPSPPSARQQLPERQELQGANELLRCSRSSQEFELVDAQPHGEHLRHEDNAGRSHTRMLAAAGLDDQIRSEETSTRPSAVARSSRSGSGS